VYTLVFGWPMTPGWGGDGRRPGRPRRTLWASAESPAVFSLRWPLVFSEEVHTPSSGLCHVAGTKLEGAVRLPFNGHIKSGIAGGGGHTPHARRSTHSRTNPAVERRASPLSRAAETRRDNTRGAVVNSNSFHKAKGQKPTTTKMHGGAGAGAAPVGILHGRKSYTLLNETSAAHGAIRLRALPLLSLMFVLLGSLVLVYEVAMDSVEAGPGRYCSCSPHHRMRFNSRNRGLKCGG